MPLSAALQSHSSNVLTKFMAADPPEEFEATRPSRK